eukprot:6256517-Prymnesium_polylepis.1
MYARKSADPPHALDRSSSAFEHAGSEHAGSRDTAPRAPHLSLRVYTGGATHFSPHARVRHRAVLACGQRHATADIELIDCA